MWSGWFGSGSCVIILLQFSFAWTVQDFCFFVAVLDMFFGSLFAKLSHTVWTLNVWEQFGAGLKVTLSHLFDSRLLCTCLSFLLDFCEWRFHILKINLTLATHASHDMRTSPNKGQSPCFLWLTTINLRFFFAIVMVCNNRYIIHAISQFYIGWMAINGAIKWYFI